MDNEPNIWLEKLQFYTKDLTKDEAKNLVGYVVWKKCEIAFLEGEEIKKLIDKPEPPKQ